MHSQTCVFRQTMEWIVWWTQRRTFGSRTNPGRNHSKRNFWKGKCPHGRRSTASGQADWIRKRNHDQGKRRRRRQGNSVGLQWKRFARHVSTSTKRSGRKSHFPHAIVPKQPTYRNTDCRRSTWQRRSLFGPWLFHTETLSKNIWRRTAHCCTSRNL